jgi:cytochrome c peroxidase
MRRVRALIATCALSLAAAGGAAQPGGYEWHLPRGFPEPLVPADNPMSDAKVALGARLFTDTRLSVTGQYSCARCHSPGRAFTDGLARSRGALGDELQLNAPTLLNAAYNASLGWRDASVRTLEQQMHGPLFNEHPRELGLSGREADVVRVLAADPFTAGSFAAAFPDDVAPVSVENLIRAIAAYERTLLSADSPFDRYVFAGEHDALDAQQKRGMDLFFSVRIGCSSCHSGINFAGPWLDRGSQAGTPSFADTGTGGLMRVPTLRNVARTAPYMHDGRFATLDAVLDHYEKLAVRAPDERLERQALTTEERAALREFLESLSDAH